MVDISELKQSSDVAFLKNEIERRKKAQDQLVGNLYPSMLESEIIEIEDRIRILEKRKCKGCGETGECICEVLKIEDLIQAKEKQIKDLIEERNRIIKEKRLSDRPTIKSFFIKSLRLYKKWSYEENKIRTDKKLAEKFLRVADTYNVCRNDLYEVIEAVTEEKSNGR